MFTPSKYNKAVFEFVKNGKGNAVISAVAGAGKTTTIVEALNIIPRTKTKVFLAFNKAIVEDIKLKVITSNAFVMTLHSAGCKAMMSTYRSRLDNYKYTSFLNESLYMLSSQISVDMEDNIQNEFKVRVKKLFELSCAALAENSKQIEEVALAHDIELLYDETSVVKKMMNWGVNQTKTISFSDMIWIPVVKKLHIQTYDWILIDECQDLSPMQLALVKMMMGANTRFIAVGDRSQAIQFFAGAGNDSFDNIVSIPNTIELPLSICYRCDKNIVDLAKTINPNIESRDNAEDGIVEKIDKIDVKDLTANSMILSRVNAPLTNVCMKLIANNIPAYVKGQEIGKNLISLIRRTRCFEVLPMFDMLENELYKVQVKLSKKHKISMEEAKEDIYYLSLQDKIECIHNLSFSCTTTIELITKISDLFKDNGSGICCSSIHKSKGLQADKIFIIALDKLPLKKAMNNPIQAVQERNLIYVAYTRALHELYLVDNYHDIKFKE